MRRQTNMAQMKEKNKTPQKEPNKMETSTPLDAKLKTLVLRMLKGRRERTDELSENCHKERGNIKTELEDIKENQSGMKNTLTEMKNILCPGWCGSVD